MSGRSFYPIAADIAVAPLLERLAVHPKLWQTTLRETFQGSPHGAAQSIILRWARVEPGEDPVQVSFEKTDEFEDLPVAQELQPALGEAVMSVLERLGAIGELGRVILTRLPPGAAIASHVDEGAYSEFYDRFHLCLAGDAGNVFECGGEILRPVAGEAFWFNHKRPHSVRNEGAIDRVHLIVDVMAPHFTRLRGLYYQAELASSIWEDITPLLSLHWREVAHYQDIPLEPDVEAYSRMEAAGQLRCYTVRDGGELAGYAVFFVRPNHHYKGSLQAWQDVLYLDPAYRQWMAGTRLIRFAERRLRAEGVQVVFHHAKRTNNLGRLLGGLGYELIEEIYGKRLDEGDKGA